MRAWFVVSWLFAFPIACGLATAAIPSRSPMSGGRITYVIESPALLFASAFLFVNVLLATADFIRNKATRRDRT